MTPPPGLPPHRLAAWDILAAGGSYKAAAEAADRTVGTVSKWVRTWRNQHGTDLFRNERQVVAASQTAAAREAAEQTWLDLRTREARNLGVTASQIRARALELLPTVGTTRIDRGPDGQQTPVVVHGPDARQIKALADATARLLEVAELIEGNPTRHTMRSVPSDQYGMGGHPEPEISPEDRKARVIDLAARLRERRSG